MSRRPTKALQVFLVCAAVFALILGATGMAVADDPSVDTTEATTPDTTADTTPDTTADTTPDTTPDTTEDTTPTTTEDTTPTTAPPESELGALDLGALAATPGHLEVTKVADAGDPEQTFTFTLYSCPSSVSPLGSCSTTETQNITVGGGTGSASAAFSTTLTNQAVGLFGLGPRYRIVETVPAGWYYQGSSCSGNGTNSSLLFDAGQQFRQTSGTAWNCTFDNVNYDVTINKTVEGTDGEFDISLQRCNGIWVAACIGSWDTIDTTSYSNGDSLNFPDLDPGLLNAAAFRVVEEVTDGYRLTSVECTGGGTIPNLGGDDLSVDGLVFFLSADNPSRTCTFVNTENRITITKATSPTDAPRDFTINVEKCEFSVFANCLDPNWDPVAASPYTLSDGDSVSITGTDVEATFFDRFFRVQEDDPGEWDVAVECSGQFGIGSPVSITRGEAFTFSLLKNVPAVADCTITNTTETGSITVAKVTDPAGGEDFDFSFVDADDPSGPTPQEFSLNDDESTTFADLFPSGENGYEITETNLPDGWSLDDITCPDADVDVDLPNNTVAVFLERGENVTCTFTNTNPLEPAISMTKTPDPTSAVVGDTITYTYVVTNEGPVEVSDLTVVDTPLGDVTLDNTTLAPTGQPGDTATGTLTREVTDADAGTTITNTALATGLVSCNPEEQVCNLERGTTEVTAEADASVGVAAVGGEVVTVDPVPGVSSASTDGQLPFTGSSTLGPILGALGLLLVGGLLTLLDRRRQQGLGA